MAAKPRDGEHLGVLDGLRGLAIVLVVLAHSGQMGYRPGFDLGPIRVGIQSLTVGGSLGVEMFFYLSGFVLFLPYARAMVEGTALPTLGHFIDRRVMKIVPSFYLVVIVSGLFLYQAAAAVPDVPREIFRHLAFVFPFWHDSLYSISSPLWSLGIEVQFYVLFPAIAACMRRRPLQTFAALVVIGESFRLWLASVGYNNDMYWVPQLPGQIDIFGLGMISAYGYLRFRAHRFDGRVSAIATVLAAASFVVGAIMVNNLYDVTVAYGTGAHFAWHNDHRLLFGVVMAVLTLSSLFARASWRAIVANPILVWFSVISYNLYLWHVPIKSQCEQTGFPCSSIPAPWSVDPNWSFHYFWAYIVLSVGVAALVTYGIERPLQRLGGRGVLRVVGLGSVFPAEIPTALTPALALLGEEESLRPAKRLP
jgi:peptidoglycan/LPS O-acetylase OafA/YrhL